MSSHTANSRFVARRNPLFPMSNRNADRLKCGSYRKGHKDSWLSIRLERAMATPFHGVLLLALLAGLLSCALPAQAQVSVLTQHNDNSRDGQNTQEMILTPVNVNSAQFGKLFSVTLDGYVYAQPLYLYNLTISGGTHNVVFVEIGRAHV